MKPVAVAMLLVASVIHLMPLVGVLGAGRLEDLYGVPLSDPNLEILMRQRAVLFGLLGVLLASAAFKPSWRPLAFIAGGVSVGSFIVVASLVGGYNEHIGRVVTADLVAAACLVVGVAADAKARRATSGRQIS